MSVRGRVDHFPDHQVPAGGANPGSGYLVQQDQEVLSDIAAVVYRVGSKSCGWRAVPGLND